MAPPTPRFPDTVPILRGGGGVLLRALDEADIPAWFARATDAESAALAGDAIPASIAEGAAWLARHRARFAARSAIRWGIDTPGAPAVGTVGLVLATDSRAVAELAIVLGRAHWRQGIGAAAAAAVLDWAFAAWGLDAVRAEFVLHNAASRRLLHRLGFCYERTIPGDPALPPGSDDAEVHVLPRAAWGGGTPALR